MHIFFSLIALSAALFLLAWAWNTLNWVWFKPKKIEKRLREQGIGGNSYKLLHGDVEEMSQMDVQAKTRPIKFEDDIIPRVIPFLYKTIKTYGNYCFMWDGPTPSVIILDPKLIGEVFMKNYVFQKNPSSVGKLLAKGLQSYDTDKWTKHRRLLNHAFHMEKLKHMLPAFDLSCHEMLSKWEKIVPSEGSCELDVWPFLQTLTSDAISRTAFGSNYEEGRRIFELQKDLSVLIFQGSRSNFIPGTRYLPTKRNRRIKAIAKEAHSSVLNIINNRVKAMQEGEPIGDDLLGILLESNFKEIEEQGSKKFGMSFREVIEECKLFYFAGQETTAALLVWTMILLGKHTEWQDRARAEVLQIFGNNKPDLEGLNHLKVVVMIFHEVLRLYPVAVMIRRIIHEETKLGHFSVPAETLITLPVIMLHTDEKIWGSDAKEFNPGRFSEGVSKATNGQLVYFPFGWGPRICIAQNFAMLEAKMVMSRILQRFSFDLSPSYAHAPNRVFALQPQYGAQLIFHKQ